MERLVRRAVTLWMENVKTSVAAAKRVAIASQATFARTVFVSVTLCALNRARKIKPVELMKSGRIVDALVMKSVILGTNLAQLVVSRAASVGKGTFAWEAIV